MRLILASWAIPLAISAALAVPVPSLDDPHASPSKEGTEGRGVAYFEAPRSIGTPLDDVARTYGGQGLADRIAGRFRLESDVSLTAAARQLIRRRLALGS